MKNIYAKPEVFTFEIMAVTHLLNDSSGLIHKGQSWAKDGKTQDNDSWNNLWSDDVAEVEDEDIQSNPDPWK